MSKLVNFARAQNKHYANLRADIEEEREFFNEGFERIKKYYELPPERREKETALKPSPHEVLRQFSEDFVSLGISSKGVLRRAPPDYLLVGMGTELLLKAIILKKRPKIFIEKRNKLMFEQCKCEIIKLLPEKFSLKQARRIENVLTLVQLRRNNLAHSGFHQYEVYMFPYQMAHVLEFLYNHFFPETSKEILAKLREFKRERKVVSEIDYEVVEFE